MKKLSCGIDIVLDQANKFQHVKAGLVTNNVATTSIDEPSRVALLKKDFNITKLFSPEHGLSSKGEDGAFQSNSIDAITKLPVISLYGNHLTPTEEDLSGIDTVFFDIPDVGCRFYTYLWTMSYVMEACATYKKKFIVLDRPNPIGGAIEKAEGPMLDEINCASFIGRWNIPVRHSCTLGELANYFAATKIKGLDLEIIKLQNWNRKQSLNENDFIPTSPAIKNFKTALLYPGMGLLEGINVNEGRGTDTDFKIMGAPWINAEQLNKAFSEFQLPGIETAVINYTPAWGMYAGEKCNGLKFSVTDFHTFRPVDMGLKLLKLILSLFPRYCKERLYPTLANPSGSGHLDKLTGVCNSFDKIIKGELISSQLQASDWKEKTQPHLLY